MKSTNEISLADIYKMSNEELLELLENYESFDHISEDFTSEELLNEALRIHFSNTKLTKNHNHL